MSTAPAGPNAEAQLCAVPSERGQRLRISWGAGSELFCVPVGEGEADHERCSPSSTVQWWVEAGGGGGVVRSQQRHGAGLLTAQTSRRSCLQARRQGYEAVMALPLPAPMPSAQGRAGAPVAPGPV